MIDYIRLTCTQTLFVDFATKMTHISICSGHVLLLVKSGIKSFRSLSKFVNVVWPSRSEKILIGDFSKAELPLYIMSILVKRELIRCKWEGELPSVRKVWSELLHIARVERLICMDKQQDLKFLEIWGQINQLGLL